MRRVQLSSSHTFRAADMDLDDTGWIMRISLSGGITTALRGILF